MNLLELEKWLRRKTAERLLQNRWPLLGPWLRRKAAERLAYDRSAEAVPILIEALKYGDEQVCATANEALRRLWDQEAIDQLCAIWVEKRDPVLASLLREKRYVAAQPVKVRVLSSLLAQRRATDAEALPALIEALQDADAELRAAADAALRSLRDPQPIDQLCAIWVERRDPALASLLREKRYVAAQPVKVRVLSSLLAQQPATDAEAVPTLLDALEDADVQLRAAADAALRALTHRDSVDALCALAVREPAGAAAKICAEERKRPSVEQACLLLVVTRRLDEYFQEDFEFQGLRQAYDRADEALKALVMDVVRGGDRRFLGFFGRRKPLSECSDREIRLAIDTALRHGDWARLFRAFQELPMKYGFPLIEEFRRSGWEPEQADLNALYRGILTESNGESLPPQPPPPRETSSVLETWLAEGRSGEYSRLGEAELVQRLTQATPPEGVKIAAALGGKVTPGSVAARAVENSQHWLVRLAGHALGLCGGELLVRDDVEVRDDNYWVHSLVSSAAVLDFWPAKAAPSDVERFNAAPREAFIGRYGAVCRVLRLLLVHRVTTTEMTEVGFDGGQFTAEFTEA
jgi:HEAT repeat protein